VLESRRLASIVDGVVLVVESGKSRIQVAKRAKQEIESAGGRLLGVVYNRRNFTFRSGSIGGFRQTRLSSDGKVGGAP